MIEALDLLAKRKPEITDTEVRAVMAYTVFHGFIVPDKNYRMAHSLMCMNPITEWRLRRILRRFLREAKRETDLGSPLTPQSRYESFFESRSASDQESGTWLYFGPTTDFETMRVGLTGFTPPSRWKMYTMVFEVIWDVFGSLLRDTDKPSNRP